MPKEYVVNVIIERPLLEKEVGVIPKEKISSGPKKTLREAVEEATQKTEERLKELGLWGHLYVAFKVEGTAPEGMWEILEQLGWQEKISYNHKKKEERKENGWIKEEAMDKNKVLGFPISENDFDFIEEQGKALLKNTWLRFGDVWLEAGTMVKLTSLEKKRHVFARIISNEASPLLNCCRAIFVKKVYLQENESFYFLDKKDFKKFFIPLDAEPPVGMRLSIPSIYPNGKIADAVFADITKQTDY